jgi:hypothetical protein
MGAPKTTQTTIFDNPPEEKPDCGGAGEFGFGLNPVSSTFICLKI